MLCKVVKLRIRIFKGCLKYEFNKNNFDGQNQYKSEKDCRWAILFQNNIDFRIKNAALKYPEPDSCCVQHRQIC